MDLELEITIEEEIDAGIPHKEAVTDIGSITDPTNDRYHTFSLLSWWQQDTVRSAKALVIGAGALGNEVLKNLALMGIGHILIVDFDTIEDSNLSRSILYRTGDNGKKKAEVAARAVHEVNPDVKVEWMHCDITTELGLGIYRRADVVIGCLDNREARLSINRACWHLGKPWVDGAIEALIGVARVFWPQRGACYECTLTDEDYRVMARRESCQFIAQQNIVERRVPTTPTISSIIGAIETQEALKILHDMNVVTGQGLVFNGLNNETFMAEYAEDELCQSHWLFEEIIELPEATAAKTTLREIHALASERLGESVIVEIPAFVTELSCIPCGAKKDLVVPRHKLTAGDVYCLECGELMHIEQTERYSGDGALGDLALEAVGIPKLDVVRTRTDSYEYAYFELTGDAGAVFGSR